MDMKMDMDCRDMGMCFTASKKLDHLLFKGWQISSVGDLIGSMFASFVFAFVYEILKAGIMYYYSKPASSQCSKTETNDEQRSLVSEEYSTSVRHMGKFHIKEHIGKTFLYVSNIVYAYILMLVAMSYNIWLFIALVLGLGTGYLFAVPFFESFVTTTTTKRMKSYGTLGSSDRAKTL